MKHKYTPLDIKTVLKCKKEDDLTGYFAPKVDETYRRLNYEFIDLFTDLVKQYPENDFETVALKSVMNAIIAGLMLTLRRALDLSVIEDKGATPLYDVEFSPIISYLKNDIDMTVFDSPRFSRSIINMRSGGIKNNLRLLRRKFQRLRYDSNSRVDIMRPNPLLQEYVRKNNLKAVELLPGFWKLDYSYGKTDKLSKMINDINCCYDDFLKSMPEINSKYYDKIIKFGEHKIERTLVEGFVLTNSLINKIKRIKTSDKLLSGSPKATGKILGWYYQDNSKDVYRFAHGGGEWGYFEDYQVSCHEFVYCSKYFVHSKKEAEAFNDMMKSRTLSDNMCGNKAVFDYNGSEKYRNFIRDYKISDKSKEKRLIYVTTSYSADEIQLYPLEKVEDFIYLEYQIWLLEELKKRGWEVKAKIHPKGSFYQGGFLKDFSSKIITGRFNPKDNIELRDNVAHVFDMAGTAFCESMSFSSDTILIDDCLRKWNSEAKKAVSTRCKIIDSYIDDMGRLRVDVDKLEEMLLSRGLNLTQEFIENYF